MEETNLPMYLQSPQVSTMISVTTTTDVEKIIQSYYHKAWELKKKLEMLSPPEQVDCYPERGAEDVFATGPESSEPRLSFGFTMIQRSADILIILFQGSTTLR